MGLLLAPPYVALDCSLPEHGSLLPCAPVGRQLLLAVVCVVWPMALSWWVDAGLRRRYRAAVREQQRQWEQQQQLQQQQLQQQPVDGQDGVVRERRTVAAQRQQQEQRPEARDATAARDGSRGSSFGAAEVQRREQRRRSREQQGLAQQRRSTDMGAAAEAKAEDGGRDQRIPALCSPSDSQVSVATFASTACTVAFATDAYASTTSTRTSSRSYSGMTASASRSTSAYSEEHQQEVAAPQAAAAAAAPLLKHTALTPTASADVRHLRAPPASPLQGPTSPAVHSPCAPAAPLGGTGPAIPLPVTQLFGPALGWGAARSPPLTRVLKVTPMGTNSSSNNSSTVLMSRELMTGAGPSPGGSPGGLAAAAMGAAAAAAVTGGVDGSAPGLPRRLLPPLAPYQGLTTTRCVSVKVSVLSVVLFLSG